MNSIFNAKSSAAFTGFMKQAIATVESGIDKVLDIQGSIDESIDFLQLQITIMACTMI